MAIINLTQTLIPTLRCPESKNRIEFCDSELPGLFLEVRSSGASTYHLRYKVDGNTKYIKLGTSDVVTLADARKKAKTLKAEIALGADPRGEQKKQKAVLTYSEFFEQHYLAHVKPRKRSWESDESIYRVHLKEVFGDKRLNQITRQQIQEFHTKLKGTGRAAATCNHTVKLLKHSLNLAIDWDMLEKNPASRVPLFLEDNKVENILDREQLEKLLTILRTDSNRPVCLILLLLLSTGARLNEGLSAKWEHINRKHRVWRIPASNSKSKRMRLIPLNNSAMEVLSQLDTEGVYEHLFVNKQRSKKLKKEAPYTTITKVWDRIRKEAGIPHFRIHDSRHLFCSWLVSSGVPIYSVMSLAGHADVKTTQRYAHLSTKALQDASASASVIIQSAMQEQIHSVTQMEFVPSETNVVQVAELPEMLKAA